MKKLLITLFLGALISTAFAQDQRFIEVVVNEEMDIMPDELSVSFRLRERTEYDGIVMDEAVEAVEEVVEGESSNRNSRNRRQYKKLTVAEQEQNIKAFLKSNGIDAENLSLSADMDFSSRNFIYYSVKLNNPEKFSTILMGLDSLGASNIRPTTYKNTKIDQYKTDMAISALKKAKEKAKKMAAVYGEKVGKVISITEHLGDNTSEGINFLNLIMLEMRKDKKKSFSMPVTYTVKVQFALQ